MAESKDGKGSSNVDLKTGFRFFVVVDCRRWALLVVGCFSWVLGFAYR